LDIINLIQKIIDTHFNNLSYGVIMAKKKLGFVELQWTCPNCGGVNPGPEKVCLQCGAPQPEDVEFRQVKGAELVDDEEVKERVEAGPDIHCPYCEARNPGDAEVCSQCGGDISEGQRRKSGEVLGAYKKEAVAGVPCPHCGAENPETARMCAECGGSMHQEAEEPAPAEQPRSAKKPAPKKKGVPVGLIIFLVVACIGAIALIILFTRTEVVNGSVERVGWERSIAVEGLVDVEYRDWRDQVPSDGEIQSCGQEVRSIESEPRPNSDEVCGTPYSVDTGSGFAEVVQDCEYHVYDEFCTYSVLEWDVVDNVSLSGNDFTPEWPVLSLGVDQRQGEETESYTVYFETSDGDYTYSISDYDDFQDFKVGTEWELEVNTFGGVVSVSP